MSKIQQNRSYKLLSNGKPVGTYDVSYFNGHGNAVILMNGKAYDFDPKTGECLNYPKFRLEL